VELDGSSWFEVGDSGVISVEIAINVGRRVLRVVRRLEHLKSCRWAHD
jgi:hypothetical protein